MRRDRQNTPTDHFDLLPFVAILMCTLGCLLFTTLSIASLNLTRPGGGEVFRAPEEAVLIEWGYRKSAFTKNGDRVEVGWDASAWEGMETGRVPGTAGIPPELQELLEEISSQPGKRYPFFAVRPSGFKSFAAMRAFCQQLGIRIGYDTVGEDSKVRLLYPSDEVSR